jgi:hypothetical protein
LKPLRILSFQVHHARGDPPLLLGTLGDASQEAREKDIVRIKARLSEPAYCFLIAFNPDGKEQLLYPEEESTKPARRAELSYPPEVVDYFGLTDGPGLQALVLVASRQPLPSYKHWQSRVGIAPWERLPEKRAWGVWQYDGRKTLWLRKPTRLTKKILWRQVVPVGALGHAPEAGLAGVPWATCYLATRDGPGQRLHEVGTFLKDRVGIEAIRAVAFPVRPNE